MSRGREYSASFQPSHYATFSLRVTELALPDRDKEARNAFVMLLNLTTLMFGWRQRAEQRAASRANDGTSRG